ERLGDRREGECTSSQRAFGSNRAVLAHRLDSRRAERRGLRGFLALLHLSDGGFGEIKLTEPAQDEDAGVVSKRLVAGDRSRQGIGGFQNLIVPTLLLQRISQVEPRLLAGTVDFAGGDDCLILLCRPGEVLAQRQHAPFEDLLAVAETVAGIIAIEAGKKS